MIIVLGYDLIESSIANGRGLKASDLADALPQSASLESAASYHSDGDDDDDDLLSRKNSQIQTTEARINRPLVVQQSLIPTTMDPISIPPLHPTGSVVGVPIAQPQRLHPFDAHGIEENGIIQIKLPLNCQRYTVVSCRVVRKKWNYNHMMFELKCCEQDCSFSEDELRNNFIAHHPPPPPELRAPTLPQAEVLLPHWAMPRRPTQILQGGEEQGVWCLT